MSNVNWDLTYEVEKKEHNQDVIATILISGNDGFIANDFALLASRQFRIQRDEAGYIWIQILDKWSHAPLGNEILENSGRLCP